MEAFDYLGPFLPPQSARSAAIKLNLSCHAQERRGLTVCQPPRFTSLCCWNGIGWFGGARKCSLPCTQCPNFFSRKRQNIQSFFDFLRVLSAPSRAHGRFAERSLRRRRGFAPHFRPGIFLGLRSDLPAFGTPSFLFGRQSAVRMRKDPCTLVQWHVRKQAQRRVEESYAINNSERRPAIVSIAPHPSAER
jgi:hypothetical protein